jgi:DNA-binding transcriptional MerR regulator
VVETLVGIGEFSKMTYLSIKALRHYHNLGLLEPADIDPMTGYRRYATSQVPVAHAIRRFRDLDMPLDEIRQVLEAPDVAASNQAILRHLERMQRQLEQTQRTVASLQDVLSGSLDGEGRVEIRRLPPVHVLAEVSTVAFDEGESWLKRALARLQRQALGVELEVCGPDGALFSDELFEIGKGEVTAFVPVEGEALVSAGSILLGAGTAAVLVHEGALDDLDRTYGALGTIVAERGIGGPGPIREHFLSETRTEVCWPVTTGGGDSDGD